MCFLSRERAFILVSCFIACHTAPCAHVSFKKKSLTMTSLPMVTVHNVVDTLRDAHVDDTSFMSCPSLLQHCSRLQCRPAVNWHFIFLHRGPARPPAPAYGIVKNQPCMPRTFRGTVQKRTARGTSTLLVRGTGCGRPLADVLPGWVILARILKTPGLAIPLAVHVCEV